MLKTWLARACLTLCLATSSGSTFGSPYPEADRYYAVRDKTPLVVENVTFAQVRANVTTWKEALIEVRGVITGCARRDDGGTFVVTREAGDTFVIEAGQKVPESTVDIARTVRILARVPPDRPGFGSLQLVAVTSEYEAASLDVERAKRRTAARSTPPAPKRAASGKKTVRHALSRRKAVQERRNKQTMLASRGLDALGQYAAAVQWFNPRLSDAEARRLAQSIIYYSVNHGLDARLIMAVIAVESNFDVNAVSPKGAMGLGQLMPGTAGDLGVADPYHPDQNLEGSTRLLRGHLRRMGAGNPTIQPPTWEQIKLALACYNAGAGAVRKYKGVPPYRETKNYVKKVGRLYYQMCGLAPPE
jgi:soluble lytic murein transglycosylase-like protein